MNRLQVFHSKIVIYEEFSKPLEWKVRKNLANHKVISLYA